MTDNLLRVCFKALDSSLADFGDDDDDGEDKTVLGVAFGELATGDPVPWFIIKVSF